MRNKRQFISLLLALALLLGMIPGMAVSALAESIQIGDNLPVEAVEQSPAQTDLGDPALEQTESVTEERANASGYAKPFIKAEDSPVESDVSKLNGKNWMAGIRGDRYLNEFNIPYTHDSGMADYIYHLNSVGALADAGAYARTQYHFINKQLEYGVRILDLRLNNWYERKEWYEPVYSQRDDGHNLYICHGKKAWAGVYYAANKNGDYLTIHQVFYTIRDFLKANPTETVICSFEIELDDGDKAKYGDKIANRLSRIISSVFMQTNPSTGKPYIYTEPGLSSWDKPYTHMPQLKDCRGQVVMMPSASKIRAKIGGMQPSIVKDNKILGGSNTCNATHKIDHLEEDMAKFNVALPTPGQRLDMLRIIDTNSHAEQIDDFLNPFDIMKPLSIARKVHSKVFGEGKLLSQVGRYYGWVKMDGATESACRYVWKTNFPNYDATSNETVTITVTPGLANDPHYAAYYAYYPTQTYVFPKGSIIVFPDDIYDPLRFSPYNLSPWFVRWIIRDTNGRDMTPTDNDYQPGDVLRLTQDWTITPYYNPNHAKVTFIKADWQDCDDADGLRPRELNVVCTYIDTDNVQKEEILTLERDWGPNNYRSWFTGDLRAIRPDWKRIPSGTGVEQGVDSKEYYRYELEGDPTKDRTVTIRMIHTAIENNAKTVTGGVSWEDYDDVDHVRPDSVTLHLLADGVDTGKSVVVTEKTRTDEDGTESTGWTWEIPNCMVYRNGQAIDYTVREDAIDGYNPVIDGTDVQNIHETAKTVKRVQIVWDDNNNEKNLRPESVHLNLEVKHKDTQKWVAVGDADILSSENTGDIAVYGKYFAELSKEDFWLTVSKIDGYAFRTDWVEEAYDNDGNLIEDPDANSDRIARRDGYFKVVFQLAKSLAHPSDLDGVYRAGHKMYTYTQSEIVGDWIQFGLDGTYIQGDDGVLSRCTATYILNYDKYEDGYHCFTIGEWTLKLQDDNTALPWGIQVTGGEGTEDNPYTFRTLHLEPVSYWRARYEESSGEVIYSKHTIPDYTAREYTPVTKSTDELVSGRWYVLDGNVELDHPLSVKKGTGSTAHLVLRYGAKLMANQGILVNEGLQLNIYTEMLSGNGGAGIYAELRNYGMGDSSLPGAAIGGGNYKTRDTSGSGTIVVHNGTINALASNSSRNTPDYPAIGRSDAEANGQLIVYGGCVNANTYGLNPRNAIDNMDVTVYGGMVIAAMNEEGKETVAINGKITTGKGIAVYEGYYPLGTQPDPADEILQENGDYAKKQQMTIRVGLTDAFIYEGNYKTITAAKRNETVSLTLAPAYPEGTEEKVVYDGGPKPVSLIGVDEFNQKTGQQINPASVKYYELQNDFYTAMDAAPVNAGEYMAELELENVPVATEISDDGYVQYTSGTVKATAYYTIEKAPVVITETPNRINITYGDTLGEYDVNRFGFAWSPNIQGVFAWEDPNIKPSAIVKREEYTVIFTPTGEYAANYASATCKVDVRVNPAAPSDVTFPTSQTLTYNGKDQALIEPGSSKHGVMMYALGDDQPTDDRAWSYTIPTAREAGTYKVWYKVFGDVNYFDIEYVDPIEVTIEQDDSEGGVNPDTLVYTGEPQELVKPGAVQVGGDLQYFLGETSPIEEENWSKYIPTGTNAGDYTVWYRVKGDANHNDYGPKSISVTIAKAPIAPILRITGWTYGKAANDPVLEEESNPGQGAVTFRYSDARNGTFTETVPAQAGSWYVQAVVGETANYKGRTTAPLNFHIAKVNIAIFADDKAGAFGDALLPLYYWMGGNVVNGDDLDIALSTTATADSAPGDYPISIHWSGNPNYYAILKDGVYTIGKRSVTVAANNQTITAGGSIATGMDQVSTIGLADGHRLSAVTLTTSYATTTAPTITVSDAKIVDANGNDVTAHYAITYVQGELTIINDQQGHPHGTSGEQSDGQPEGKPGEQPEGKPEGKPGEQPEGKPGEQPEGMPGEQPEEKPEEQPEGKPEANPDFTLLLKMTTSGSNTMKLSWTKVDGAKGYDVFFMPCDGDQDYTRIATTKKLSYTVKGLKQGKPYKAYVLAWRRSGGRKYYIGDASPVVHAIIGGYTSKQCNAKSIKLNKNSLTLDVGKSTKLKATVKGVKRGRKLLQHARLVRYYSSDVNVARVNKKGEVTAVSRGACTIYAITNNGLRARVKVTVN